MKAIFMMRACCCFAVLIVLVLAVPRSASAQIEVEAYSGEPFGVGVISVRMRSIRGTVWSHDDGWSLQERTGRSFYPAVVGGPLRDLLRQFVGRPFGRAQVYFLFQGDEPLDLTLHTPGAQRARVRPVADERRHQRLLRMWWQNYTKAAKRRLDRDQYPPMLDAYLTSMLAHRLRLSPPKSTDDADPFEQTLAMLMGSESTTNRVLADAFSQPSARGKATLPLPPNPPARAAIPGPPTKEVAIEAIANHVPAECFYVRFGNYSNFLWVQALLNDWGGDLRSMIAARAVNVDQSARIERQLVLKQTKLSKIFGPTVIADVAMIGSDMFFREGASFGILFQTRSSAVLGADLRKQRAAALKNVAGCTETKHKIAGHDVSLLLTPDGSVRSFYAVDGDYHFVTTSRTLVQRFYEAGSGKRPLSGTSSFRLARAEMPSRRGDAVFAYLSPEFFNNLMTPHYRIEMQRRVRSVVDMQMLTMARLAAKAEGRSHKSIADLVQGGFLPDGFGIRPDGSRLIEQDGRLGDSRRGGRGSFVAVPDMKISGITAAELDSQRQLAAAIRADWQAFDPLLLRIQRKPADKDNRERLVIDARVPKITSKPLAKFTAMLGRPTTRRLKPIGGDVISAQIVLNGKGTLRDVGEHHLFAGLQDVAPLVNLRGGPLLMLTQLNRALHGYVGAWPQPGYLRLLEIPRQAARGTDRDGNVPARFGTWQHLAGRFTLFSFQRELLPYVSRQLEFEEAPRAAQAWLRIGDLSQAKLAASVNKLGHMKARKVSAGNLQLLQALSDQFHVPPPQALGVAQQLVDARLVCPLGGDYKPITLAGGLETWQSTAWSRAGGLFSGEIPADYQMELLRWFRGMDANLIANERTAALHVEIVMQRPAKKDEGGSLFNPFSIFGSGKKARK